MYTHTHISMCFLVNNLFSMYNVTCLCFQWWTFGIDPPINILIPGKVHLSHAQLLTYTYNILYKVEALWGYLHGCLFYSMKIILLGKITDILLYSSESCLINIIQGYETYVVGSLPFGLRLMSSCLIAKTQSVFNQWNLIM